MILDTTSKTIEIVLASAKTTNDCEYTADWADTASGSTFVPGGSMGTTNGTSAVTPVAAPSGSIQRHVKALTVYNADTVNTTVTVRMYDGTNRRGIVKIALAPGQSIVWTAEGGWSIFQTTPGQIPGTATNDNAAAGMVGEYVEAILASGSAISLTSGTAVNITSLTLGAGDYDLTGIGVFGGSSSTTFQFVATAITTVSATLPGSGQVSRNNFYLGGATPLTQTNPTCQVGPVRQSLSTSTTIYLVAQAGFATSTANVFGQIRARRVR